MSLNAVEKLLWLIGNDHAEAERFIADRDAYLDRFPLDAEERRMVAELQVGRLAQLEVNPLLLLAAFRAVQGPDSISDYMARMNAV